jgi:hypothetical protein
MAHAGLYVIEVDRPLLAKNNTFFKCIGTILKVKLQKGEIVSETTKSTGISKTAVFAKVCCLC